MDKVNNIKGLITRHREEIKERYNVNKIGIFGSYIKNKQDRKSDLDILVDYKEEPGLFDFIRLENYLSKILKIKIDLVMKNSLKPSIGKHILREVIYL